MKSYVLFIFCSVMLYSSISAISTLKPNLRNNKSTQQNTDSKENTPLNNPAFIEKTTRLFDTAEIDLTPTINLNEGSVDYDDQTNPFQEDENNPSSPRPKANLIQKKEKIIDNKKESNKASNQPKEVDKKERKYEKVFKHADTKAYNYNPLFEKSYSKHLEQPKRVKSLLKDNPIKHAQIPPTFGPVQVVKQLSATAQADIKNQMNPSE